MSLLCESKKVHWPKAVLIFLLLTMLVAFILMNAISQKIDISKVQKFIDKIGKKVSSENQSGLSHQSITKSQTSISAIRDKNGSKVKNPKCVNGFDSSIASYRSWVEFLSPRDKLIAYKEFTKIGIESTLLHDFKSPFLEDPKLYGNPNFSPQASRRQSAQTAKPLKIISCFNCPAWFSTDEDVRKNVDFANCPYKCTFDRSGLKSSKADAVIFFVGALGRSEVPQRPLGQIWVKAYWESPAHYRYPKNYAPWKSAFNWTFNYRVDSDIFAPYNRLAWRDRHLLLSDQEYLWIAGNKTRTAAWFVSNCHTQSKRREYVNRMQKFTDIDIYGRCGTETCTRKDSDDCERLLTTTYKFYLSFENSLCEDYVTEKFFRSFYHRAHVIPVVRGGFQYDKYIPPGGYINAAHFPNPKALALYLNKLSEDTQSYAKMLKEKDMLVALNYKLDFCDMCEKLNTLKEDETRIVPDIQFWSHHEKCAPPNDL